MMYHWAEPYPEIHKICTLFNLTEISKPSRYSYKPLQSYLQEGPQCGLIALAMVKGNTTREYVNNILEYAKKKGYTKNGEIFSVDYMEKLAREFLKAKYIDICCADLQSQKMREILLNGAQLLVPYDTNKDNSPGFHRGHKAHWCAVSGAVETENNFFVIARHGKAKNVGIWSLEELARSNSQLYEFSPDRKFDNLDYCLPTGGICGPCGLNERSIVIFEEEM
ncbi:actin maturation protease [Cylas formicarius]|uniref:actin maturation protease n=1 Tax=Cylas formicarius TaxID=197179 RepID=UPI0029586404|nr:actin maturation protease [Cylas formicarius]